MTREHIGANFQRETKYVRGRPPAGHTEHIIKTPLYKGYAVAMPISLPEPQTDGGGSLRASIRERRSQRDYVKEEISLQALSQLLWACQGVTGRAGPNVLRAAPSAGALYPIENYLVVNRVSGLEPGLYHYGVEGNELHLVKAGDMGRETARAALGQNMCEEASVVFIWTAVFARSRWKYKQRGYRYVYLDAGHICSQLSLAAVDQGLGSCAMAAFYDDEVNRLLGVDGKEESALYLCSVGKVRE